MSKKKPKSPYTSRERGPEHLPLVRIYTDGACTPNPGVGGYAAILCFTKRDGTEATKEVTGREAASTNNRAELLGVILGLRTLTKQCRVYVYSDSRYITQAYTEDWVRGWRKRGWKKTGGRELLNADLWEILDDLVQRHVVTFQWVRGHNGNYWNERADMLAVHATHPDFEVTETTEKGATT